MFNIVLDPGHGRTGNPGIIDGFYEGTNNWEACIMLKKILECYKNVSVTLTKDNIDIDPPTISRGICGNNADLFFSWHSNGFNKETAYGLSSFYSILVPEDKDFCKAITDAILPIFGSPTYDRGQCIREFKDNVGTTRDYYGVIRNSMLTNGNSFNVLPIRSKCKHSIIVEHGFHSNQRECSIIADKEKLFDIVTVEAKVIAKYFGLEIDEMKYRVFVKAELDNKDAANAMVTFLKTVGIIADVETINEEKTDEIVPEVKPVVVFKKGDKVKLNKGAKWATDAEPRAWVYNSILTILSVENDTAKVSAATDGIGYSGTAYLKDLTKV